MRPPASTNSLDVYTAGNRFLAARSTRRLCSLSNLALGSTVRPPARAGHVREGPVESSADLAHQRIEAAPLAPAPRLLLRSACPYPCVRRGHLEPRGQRPD